MIFKVLLLATFIMTNVLVYVTCPREVGRFILLFMSVYALKDLTYSYRITKMTNIRDSAFVIWVSLMSITVAPL